jgi:hypothetical protein
MARFNSSLSSNTITGASTIGSPFNGAFTQFTGTAPYTVTLPSPGLYPGINQTYYNNTSGIITLSTPSGTFSGSGGPGASTVSISANNVISLVSDGTNYIVISEDGSPLLATTGSFSSNVTMNGGSATVIITPSVVTMAPTASSTIDNIAIGSTTRASGAFTTLTSNNAVTFTANTASTTTTTGTLVVTGGIGASGTVYAGAFNGNLTGTLQTAAQPNITSTGSLTIPGLTVDTSTLVVDATNDRVGVGTAGPGAVLHVVKTVQQTDFDNANQVLQLENTSTDTSGNVSGLRFRQTNGTNSANSFIGLSSTGDSSTRANLIFASPNTSGNATIRMRVNALGQVFIGTTSTPYSGATGTGVYINGVSNQQTDLASLFVSGAKIGFAGIQSLVQNQLTVYDSTAGNGAGTGGAIAFGGNAGSGQATFYAAIESRKDNATAGDYGASLNFYTRPTGGYYTSPNMTISSSGNVGIGATASFATIDGYTQRGIEIVGTKESGTAPVIRLRETGSGLGAFEIRSNREGATSGNYLAFGEGTSTFMVLRGDDDSGSTGTRGFVGVGTTSPQNKLQVNGSLSSYNQSSSAGAIATSYSEIVTTPINLGASVGVDIGTISVTTDTCWKAVVRGTFSNNYDGGGLTPPAFYIELNSVQNTIPCGGTSITVARNASTNKLRFTNTSGSYIVAFTGTVEIIVNTQSGQSSRSITTIGAVGVGTNAPAAQLHVLNTGGSTNSPNTALILDYQSNSTALTGAGTAIEFRGKSSGGNIANYSQARIRSTSQDTNNAHGIAFDYKSDAATALTEAMRIDTGGTLVLNGSLSQTGVRTRSGTFSLPSNSGTVITVSVSNYSYVHFKVYALRTNGGNSMAYWDGIINNNNNTTYANAIAQSSGAGAVNFTVFSAPGYTTFTFNFNGSGGYGYYICEDMSSMGSISVAYP